MEKKILRLLSTMLAAALLCLSSQAFAANGINDAAAEAPSVQITYDVSTLIDMLATVKLEADGTRVYADWYGGLVTLSNGSVLVLTTDEYNADVRRLVSEHKVAVKQCAYSLNELTSDVLALRSLGLGGKLYGFSYAKVNIANNNIEVGAYATTQEKFLEAVALQEINTDRIVFTRLTETTESRKTTEYSPGISRVGAIVYTGPDERYNVIEKLVKGETIPIICEMDDWYQVVWNGKTNYMRKRDVELAKNSRPSKADASIATGSVGVASVKADAFSHIKPDAKSEKVWEYRKGYYVAVDAIMGGWAMIRGLLGNVYIQTKYLDIQLNPD